MIRLCSTILRVAAAVAVVSVMLGCQERQLCYDHSHKASVSIEFDWSLAPEADPASMVVWFFPLDGSHGHRFELTGDGMSSRGSFDAVVKVPEGSYHMVCHNGSTEFNVERGSTIGDYQIETYDVEVLSAMNRAESAPRPGDTEMQAVRSQSSRLYAHTHDDIFTVVNDPKACQKVVFTPAEKTVVCDLRVTGVQNMRPDVEVSAIIAGVSGAWHAGSQSPADIEVSVPFALDHCGSDCLKGSVVLFGLPGESHKIRIYTSYKYYYDFDVTDQVRRQIGNRKIELSLSGIKLPDAPSSGMSPGVSDWGDITEEVIPM